MATTIQWLLLYAQLGKNYSDDWFFANFIFLFYLPIVIRVPRAIKYIFGTHDFTQRVLQNSGRKLEMKASRCRAFGKHNADRPTLYRTRDSFAKRFCSEILPFDFFSTLKVITWLSWPSVVENTPLHHRPCRNNGKNKHYHLSLHRSLHRTNARQSLFHTGHWCCCHVFQLVQPLK